MSEVKRYTYNTIPYDHYMDCEGGVAPPGDYVRFEDYARLKAEVERLRASSFVTAVPVEQYERLRKAGDAMADNIPRLATNQVTAEKAVEMMKAWNAAKEGKQP